MNIELSIAEAAAAVLLIWKIAMAKTTQLNIRVLPEDLLALKKACEKTGQDQSDILRACIKAFVERVDEDEEVSRPFALVSKKLLKRIQEKKSHPESDVDHVQPLSSRSTRGQKEDVALLGEDPAQFRRSSSHSSKK